MNMYVGNNGIEAKYCDVISILDNKVTIVI